MDQLRKLQCSCEGHRSHLTKLLSNIDRILNKLPAEALTNCNIASLEDYLKQLKQKGTFFADTNRNILDNIDDEEEFEATVLDFEELQTTLSQKISLLTYQLTVPCSQVPSSTIATATNRAIATPQVSQGDVEPPNTTTDDTSVKMSLEIASKSVIRTPQLSILPPIEENSGQPQHGITNPHTLEFNSRRSERQSNSQFVTRLPKLHVARFSRDPLKWFSFWDCFKAAIHFNPCITETELPQSAIIRRSSKSNCRTTIDQCKLHTLHQSTNGSLRTATQAHTCTCSSTPGVYKTYQQPD